MGPGPYTGRGIRAMRAASLFCGAGGLDLGFGQEGIQTVVANDSWDVAARTYAANGRRDVDVIVSDIGACAPSLVRAGRQAGVDVVFGGPPCRPFSTAGRGPAADAEGARMVLEFARTAAAMRPEWIVMENVAAIASRGRRHVAQVTTLLRKAGYGTTAAVLDAADFGVPQFRRRFFLLARAGGPDGDGELLALVRRGRRDRRTVRQHIPGLDTDFYYRHPWSYGHRAVFGADGPSPTIRGVNRPVPPGYRPHRGDATRDMGLVRPLTTEERAALQAFPPGYAFRGKRDAARTAGGQRRAAAAGCRRRPGSQGQVAWGLTMQHARMHGPGRNPPF